MWLIGKLQMSIDLIAKREICSSPHPLATTGTGLRTKLVKLTYINQATRTELVVVSTRRWQYDVIRQLCHLHAHELNYFPAMTRIVTGILSIGTAVHCLLYNFQCNGQNRNYTVMRHQNYLEGYGCVMVGCNDVWRFWVYILLCSC
jgi:hypothetical protein